MHLQKYMKADRKLLTIFTKRTVSVCGARDVDVDLRVHLNKNKRLNELMQGLISFTDSISSSVRSNNVSAWERESAENSLGSTGFLIPSEYYSLLYEAFADAKEIVHPKT